MALNTLRQILEKNGSKYVDKFLSGEFKNGEVTITEKLDTYRILFENVKGEIKFFKKDNSEINLIERVLTNVWEDAIIELSIILHESHVPEGLRFGIAYTPVERPIRISYTKLPKYLITDITTRKNNKIEESYNYEDIQQWSETLNLGRPPIIFKGKLSEEQKRVLIEYSNGEYDDIENNFSELLSNRFNGTYSNQSIIEGIVISDGERLAKIESYEFKLLNEAYQKVEYSRDFYDLTILSLNRFLENYPFPIMEGENSDSMYLEMVCDIFNHYSKISSLTEGMRPEYLTPPNFGYTGGLNLLLIKNKETLELLEQGGKVHESVFRVILSSLRKFKKEYGLLNESAVNKFNSYVYKISEKISNLIIEPIEEVNEELITEKSENIVVSAVTRKMATDIDNMRVISSIQKTFEPKGREGIKGSEKCVIYLTDFKPFTKSQEDNINSMNNMWKCPVIIAFVGNSRRVRGKKFFFTDTLVKNQMKSFANSNKELVPAFFMLSDWDLFSIFTAVRPKYEPIAIITDMGKKSELAIQLYFEEEVMDERISVERDLNIGEMENKDALMAFRSIEDMDFSSFKNLVPESIYGLWDSMQSEWKTWNGKILLK
jgi:hypothetical protein